MKAFRRATKVFALSLLLINTANTEELTAAESEVWNLEEAYYQYAKNNDAQGYLSLFNDNVIGWPTMAPRPRGKNRASQWISEFHSNPNEVWQYEIERLEIQSFDNVVVVHYRLRDYFQAAGSGEELRSHEYRISHTWLKSDGRWQIISGMGGTFH